MLGTWCDVLLLLCYSARRMTGPDAPSRLESEAYERLADALSKSYRILSVKLYRLSLARAPAIPILPCLDHEAMLHEGIAPHAAAYIQERNTGELHEVVIVPARRRLDVDVVSTYGECSEESRERLLETLKRRFTNYTVAIKKPSRLRGDRRVTKACRAQVTLRDVLLGPDLDRTNVAINRLQTIGALMEKESRVASWSVRTLTGPLLAGVGFASFLLLGGLAPYFGSDWVETLRYTVIGIVGACFLYFGLKAVQLTEMSNRVWKRSAEYALLIAERRRLERDSRAASSRTGSTSPEPRSQNL